MTTSIETIIQLVEYESNYKPVELGALSKMLLTFSVKTIFGKTVRK